MNPASRSDKINGVLLGFLSALLLTAVLLIFLFCCRQEDVNGQSWSKIEVGRAETGRRPANDSAGLIDPAGRTVESRIRVAPGFARVQVAAASFAKYLRQLPLKPHGAADCIHLT
jgi:hypothetical protein